jgi:16S rRNA processing protein RimM
MAHTQSPSPDELLLVGQIGGSFGLRGQLKMAAITTEVDHLQRKIRTLYIGPRHQAYTITHIQIHKPGVLLLTLDGLTDRDAADGLRGAEVFIRESEAAPLSEGEYFTHALYGLDVLTDTGEAIGKVREVIETGANDVLVVARAEGGEALIPIIQDVIVSIDQPGGRIVIHPIPGLLD